VVPWLGDGPVGSVRVSVLVAESTESSVASRGSSYSSNDGVFVGKKAFP